MARLVYSENALGNIERAFEFLAQHDPNIATKAVEAIRDGIETLGDHPFIGRRIEGEIRELVISFGRTGYVALYRYVAAHDIVRILALRHQREIGYPECWRRSNFDPLCRSEFDPGANGRSLSDRLWISVTGKALLVVERGAGQTAHDDPWQLAPRR